MFKHRPKVLAKKAAGVLGVVGTGGVLFWLLRQEWLINIIDELGLWEGTYAFLAGGGTAGLVYGLKCYWNRRPTIEDFLE